MTPHTQAFLHDPGRGVRGDCYRTAIACLLDVPRDDVPHAPDDWINQDGTRRLLSAYLTPLGFAVLEMPLSFDDLRTVMGWMATSNPGVTYMLSGSSPRGTDHATVVHEGRLWDPHPSRAGLVGPCADGFWWIGALVKSAATAAATDPLPLPGAP